MLQGWVMFVSVFCFVMSIFLLCLYLCGAHGGGGSWVTLVRAWDRAQGGPPLPGCALQSSLLQPGEGWMGFWVFWLLFLYQSRD